MLSHTIDVAQRGDEATICSRLSNYVSGNRIPRHARLRRQIEQQEAEANAAGAEANAAEAEANAAEAEANAAGAEANAAEAAANAADEQKSDEGNSDLKDAEQVPVDDTEKESQGSPENSENTSKQVSDTDAPKEEEHEDHESDATPEQQAEVVNQSAKYVTFMSVHASLYKCRE